MSTNTTQVCKKCEIEKSLTEFHKRGASHQRICKTCRKAHVPSGKKRIVILNTPENYAPLMERINKLESKLRAKAYSYSTDPLQADDIYSAMTEEILFKSKPEDSDSRILTRATWAAKYFLHRHNAYRMVVLDESSMSGDDGEGYNEITASPTRSAEDEFIQRDQTAEIKKVLETLPQEYQVVVSKLMLGYNQREIAKELGKSDQAISSTIKNIAAQLLTLGLSPSFSFA